MRISRYCLPVLVLLCIALVALVAYRLISIYTGSVSASTAQQAGLVKEDEAFFRKLVRAGVIFPAAQQGDRQVTATQRLAILPGDATYLLKKQLETVEDAPDTEKALEKKIHLVTRLYTTEVGRTILRAVRSWNDAHFFAGIRDDSQPSNSAGSGFWQATFSGLTELQARQDNSMPDYGVFVTGGVVKPGFGPWTRAFGSNGAIEFRRTIILDQPREITVQVIGTPVSAKPSPDHTVARALPVSFPGVSSDVEEPGAALTYVLSPGVHELRIAVEPVSFRQDLLPGLNIAWKRDTSWPDGVRWVDTTTDESLRKPVAVSVVTADGTVLRTSAGELTDTAWELGLAGLVGMNGSDRNTLAWIFSKAAGTTQVTLTLDSTLQKIAQEQLELQISDLWNNDDYAGQRRGAVVMLDADSGEILAAATYPRMKKGVTPWDVQAFGRYYPNQSWISFQPWQGVDGNNAPGSTFKPVVTLSALAAIQDGAPGARRIQTFIRGYSPGMLRRGTGLRRDCAAYDPVRKKCYDPNHIPGSRRVIENFRKIPLEQAGFKIKNEKLGLVQAVRGSINVWFVRLGQLVDGDKAKKFDSAFRHLRAGQAPPARPDLYLGRMGVRLGFNGAPFNLLDNIGADIELRRSNPGENREGDVGFAATGSMDMLLQDSRGLQWILAQNSIGQGMVATPLQMARVAATVATGRPPRPVLLHAVDETELTPPAKTATIFSSQEMRLLKQGMKAVPVSGTAKKAFKGHPDLKRIYGKTGTANVGGAGKKYFSTWFIGWREPAIEGERRIAFACFITHAPRSSSFWTGGRVAAPVMAEILKEWQ